MLEKISAAVKSRRAALGVSLRSLAQRSGIPLEKLTDLEHARPGTSTVELARIAEALQVERSALLRGELAERPLPSVYLRSSATRGQDFFDEDLAVLDRAIDDARALVELGGLLDAPARRTFKRARPPNRDPAADGHKRAQQFRAALSNPAGRLDDMRVVLEEICGVAVVVRKLRSPTPAIAIVTGDAAAVVLNANIARPSDAVVRVHLAHEACHVVYDPLDGNVHVVREPVDDSSHQRVEQRARAFAAECLLPKAGLQQLLGAPRAIEGEHEARQLIARARSHFGTPWAIAAFHLGNHGYIASELKESLANRAPSGPRADVHTSLPKAGAASLLLAARTEQAHKAGLVTDGEARGLLELGLDAALPWA